MKKILMALSLMALAGCQNSQQANVPTTTLNYQCINDQLLTVALDEPNQVVMLTLEGQTQTLLQVPAASGAKYSNNDYTFWTKGFEAIVMKGDEIIISDCHQVPKVPN